ncbi:hypothetical protein [Amycolatopsis sp. NPDC006125]|uniref:hypothetical protein n=1 Tax=Amycolatopsis sp. NPDC006125 TaxID=3156730 RepID=UPI0033AA6ABE
MIITLMARFPQGGRPRIATVVREVHRDISTTATSEAHLITLTQRRTAEELDARSWQ